MFTKAVLQGLLRHSAVSHQLHTSCICRAVSKSALSKLRKKTGFPFIKCKNALVKFENDLKQAEVWLKEQAQKEGWEKASKLQGRAMSQGLVGVLLEGRTAAMVEVNCETDFVARNKKFQSLVSRVAASCLQHAQSTQEPKLLLDKNMISALKAEETKTVGDIVALEVGDLGENMAVRRAACFTTPEGLHCGSYVHAAGDTDIRDGQCSMGRYAALVMFRHTPSESPPLVEADTESPPPLKAHQLGRQLAQHIVGMNPGTIGSVDDEEKPSENVDEETKMIFQEFLLDPTLTVSEFLDQNSGSVEDFVRFHCGEELPEVEEPLEEKQTETT